MRSKVRWLSTSCCVCVCLCAHMTVRVGFWPKYCSRWSTGWKSVLIIVLHRICLPLHTVTKQDQNTTSSPALHTIKAQLYTLVGCFHADSPLLSDLKLRYSTESGHESCSNTLQMHPSFNQVISLTTSTKEGCIFRVFDQDHRACILLIADTVRFPVVLKMRYTGFVSFQPVVLKVAYLPCVSRRQ
jgi:hypothetical protein